MKILLIGPLPNPIDGCSNANKVLLRNFEARNLDYNYINTNTKIITGDQGRKFSFDKAFDFLKNYLNIFKITKAEVVYFTPGQTFYGVLKYAPFILMCLIFSKPYAIHVHGNFLGNQYRMLRGIKKKIFHFLVSKAHAGIVITKTLARNFEGLLSPERIHVVEYFVEKELYATTIVKKADRLRILYLSNLMREKGILEFLDALLLVKSKGIDFEAVVAGSIEVGLEEEVQSRFNSLGSSLNYVGVITGNEKTKRLKEANIFILPTYYTMEGLPFSLLEAIATGNIIISTKHAGIPDTVDESNGFLVEKRSSQAIADSILTISQDLTGNINKYSEHNISYALKTFTELNYTEKILSIMNGIKK